MRKGEEEEIKTTITRPESSMSRFNRDQGTHLLITSALLFVEIV